LINDLPLEERPHIGETGRKSDAELFDGQRDDAAEREDEDGGGGAVRMRFSIIASPP
jgi:hypothetical protein